MIIIWIMIIMGIMRIIVMILTLHIPCYAMLMTMLIIADTVQTVEKKPYTVF